MNKTGSVTSSPPITSRESELTVGLTLDECHAAAANIGVDLNCGECASHFYTGGSSATHELTCKTMPLIRQRMNQGRSGRSWRDDVQLTAGGADGVALPNWSQDVPWCSEACPQHDGKRCGLIGNSAPRICEPVVTQMTKLLGGHEAA